jgi:hypothetical protein
MSNTINKEGQSYLEIEGMAARHEQTGRSDYNQSNEYNAQHQDALATGDEKGKGTGDFGGHGWIAPDMSKPKEQISPMFNTDEGGNNCDNYLRDAMTARSNYGPGREYGIDYVVNTSANIMDGQYDSSEAIKLPYTCPII